MFMEDRRMLVGKNYSRQVLKGQILILTLLLFVLGLLIVSLLDMGPIILGSERNGNGSVEYLCLGTGCRDIY